MTLYRQFSTVEQLNLQYLPSAQGLDGRKVFERWSAHSKQARDSLGPILGLRFGASVDEYVDIFPCGKAHSPVHLFIHGGYWHSFSAKEFSFIATRLVPRSVVTAILNYSLCPVVTIDEIVRQTRAAVFWLSKHVQDYGGDPENITVSGHSAGAHLAAMLGSTDWKGRYGTSSVGLRGIVGISGLYDLRPFPFTALQPYLQLTLDQVMRNSPLLHAKSGMPSTYLVVGELESAEFHRQSDDYAVQLRNTSCKVSRQSIPQANHFTVLDGFMEDKSTVLDMVLKASQVQEST